MNRLIVMAVGAILWTLLAVYAGWAIRDGRADTAAANVETQQQTARAESVETARSNDHTTTQAATRAEQVRVDRVAVNEATFDQLNQDVTRYAHEHPAPNDSADDGRGPADAEFMRIWRAANAGSTSAGPGDRTGADAGAESPTATERRGRCRATGESRRGGARLPRPRGTAQGPGVQRDGDSWCDGQWWGASAAAVLREGRAVMASCCGASSR